MPKQKAPSPQEIYWARKQAQEAYLPPGLINHGNTCFMNSVLQGLIATRLLADLAQFNDIPDEAQKHSNTLLLSRRSPQFTNGHGRGGSYEKPRVDMPIGDRFIGLMYRAWSIQSQRRRESLSPKELLAAVGQKYDQYLDFAQQDAHEFLRILLDAMRMEEQDIIKQRQPPPPKQPKKRRRSSQPLPSSSSTAQPQSIPNSSQSQSSPTLPQPLPESDTLISFSDMIFGGKLTSILVCQKCKHISQTYEDFNDISLSLKPEDYAVLHSRKRDRFKNFAKKLAALPSTSLVAAANASNPSTTRAGPSKGVIKDEGEVEGKGGDDETGDGSVGKDTSASGRMGVALQIQRSSSVPPSPREREDPQISEKVLPHLVSRRRSMEHLQSDLLVQSSNVNSGSAPSDDSPSVLLHSDAVGGDVILGAPDSNHVVVVRSGTADSPASTPEHVITEAKETESDGSNVIINGAAVLHPGSPEEKRVDFVPPDKPSKDHGKEKSKEKKKRDTDGWSKIGRRISLTVGIGRREKGKDKDKDKEKDKDKKRSQSADRRIVSAPPPKTKPPVATDPPDPIPNGIPPVSDTGAHSSTSPLSTNTGITISVSSPENVSSPPPSVSSDQVQFHPPITTPVPVRSFSSQSYALPRLSTPLQSIQTHMQTINTHVQAHVQKVSGVQRSKSPKQPKQTKEEQEYLRRILADVGPTPILASSGTGDGGGSDGEWSSGGGGGKPFTKLKSTPTHLHLPGNTKSQGSQEDNTARGENGKVGTWLPLAAMSRFSGLEECLRMFTAVEVLDGENMVGCRRCWKIQNGYVKGDKDGEDSEDEEDDAKEEEGEGKKEERLLAPPVQSFNSESTTSTASTMYSSALSAAEADVQEELGGRPPFSTSGVVTSTPASASTPTLSPSSTIFTSDTDMIPVATVRPPLRSNSTTGADTWNEPTPKVPPPQPTSLQPELRNYRAPQQPSSPTSPRRLRRTPGGLPIPRISTTPAPYSSELDGAIPHAGLEEAFVDGFGDPGDEEGSGNETPVSESSSRSSTVLVDIEEEEQGSTDEEVKKRRGMIFSDSLIVPQRKPGRSGRPRPTRRGTASTDEWANSEAESGATSTSRSLTGGIGGSVSGSEESESQSESGEESVSEAGEAEPTVPPGLGHSHLASPPLNLDTSPGPVFSPSSTPILGSESTPVVKPVSKPKKKKETILRPAYKRYLVSVPPPVLVIHLKRFQQLRSSASSGLASFAEKLAAGFSVPQGGAASRNGGGGRNDSSGGGFGGSGFGGFGGIGGGGFKKLEDFVSFPEWLDLNPFLAPRKEYAVSVKGKSKPKRKDRRKDMEKGKGVKGDDERCMYRLYAVVVHIGNMLGGHYVAYVALPNEPPSSELRVKDKENKVEEENGPLSSPDVGDRERDDEASTSCSAQKCATGQKSTKRQWAYISDTNVRLTSLEEVLRARAYICMYERV